MTVEAVHHWPWRSRVEALKVEALTASLAQSVMQMPPLFLFKPPVLTSEPLLLVAEFSRYVNLVEFTNKQIYSSCFNTR